MSDNSNKGRFVLSVVVDDGDDDFHVLFYKHFSSYEFAFSYILGKMNFSRCFSHINDPSFLRISITDIEEV